MEITGDSFLRLRNDYIIPLIRYGISRRNCNYWNFKDTVTNKIVSLTHLSKNTFEIEISNNDFYKSTICEIELFKNKSLIQFCEYLKLNRKNSTWAFVSLYYFFFFTTTTLMRMLNRGYLYLGSTHVKRIELYELATHSTIIKLEPGNYFYSVKGYSCYGNMIL